jgi:putative transposase
MANTYTQIYIHIVFAVQGRQNLIRREDNDELQKDMTGIVSGQGQKLLAINNMPEHFHILIGQRPDVALSDLVCNIKAGSSGFINDRGWLAGGFSWQEGFGAFSYSHSQLSAVIRYIQNQEHHHRRKSFRRRIRRAVETLHCAARSTIPVPSREFRLDAAPTELTAF